MTRVVLPPLFADRVSNSDFAATVASAIDHCCHFYGDPTRALPFFPEYTDHGIRHIQSVLDTTAGLLTPEAHPALTPEDITVLTLAVLLHDSAMHLTPEGFLNFISDRTRPPLLPDLDDKSWPQLFGEYLAEASRWDSRRLHAVLGDANRSPEDEGQDLARFVKSPDEMGPIDRWPITYFKFLGEFIRRYHPRFAHEFAVSGIPGATANDRYILFDQGGRADLYDLAGLVARSHGIGLRDTFDYLRGKYHSTSFVRQTHVVFLMVLLRIADYLRIESERAPSASLKVRSLRNPISIREWAIHQSIRDVLPDEHDDQAVFVVAEPPNVVTYLRVRALLDGLQRELDTSWAVLGEVYSRLNDGKMLGIKLRRVRSNLDRPSQFRQTVGYLPAHFAFEAAGTGLLKKLVEPLYGGSPEVAIRELLQNALDAVNERHALAVPPKGLDQPKDGEPEVWVRIDGTSEGGGTVTVEDRGVGMTEGTLRSYFFRVGASYRESDAWRKSFAGSGTPTVIRSGRFGVGGLAAFLLGERLEVVTRHVSAAPDKAMRFSASIDDDAIEVTRVHREQPGTTIKIPIDAATFRRLSEADGQEWDWYRWSKPVVLRSINGKSPPPLTRLPLPGQNLDLEWHRLPNADFDDVIWTYGRAPRVVCNGLNIGSKASSLGYNRGLRWEGKSNITYVDTPIGVPMVSVMDRAARLPLDLRRYALIHDAFPFSDQLLADATRDFCAYCLTFAPTSPPWPDPNSSFDAGQRYPGTMDGPQLFWLHPWFYTQDGVGATHWVNLASCRFDRVYLMLGIDTWVHPQYQPPMAGEAVFLGALAPLGAGAPLWPVVSQMLARRSPRLGNHPRFFTQHKGGIVLLSSALAARFGGPQSDQGDLEGVTAEAIGPQNSVLAMRDGLQAGEMLGLGPKQIELARTTRSLWACLKQPSHRHPIRETAFSRTWNELMTHPVIPYDQDLRRSQFERAYEELAPFISKWETLRQLGARAIVDRFGRDTRHAERL